MKKLSNAQQMIIDMAKSEIDKARAYTTFEDYFMNHHAKHFSNDYNTPEKYMARDMRGYNYFKSWWEKHKEGIVICRSNSRTIKALENMGLIEIIKDGKSNQDYIKLLNY